MRTPNIKNYLLAVAMMLATATSATNYYVATTGSNSANGTTPATPFLTIQKGAQMAKAGDTVFVAPGIYSEVNIKPTNSGSLAKGHIVFMAQQGDEAVVISKENTTSSNNSNSFFDFSDKSYIWIEGFEFANTTFFFNCIRMSGAKHSVVTRCKFRNLGNEDVNDNWGGTSMIWLYKASDCIISHCTFTAIYGDGIDINGQDAIRNLICHNTFTNQKGKKRSWDSAGYTYTSGVTGQDMSRGHNIIAFNIFTGGQNGVWLDRDGSTNIIVRNYGENGATMVFNESRCARNLIQENIAVGMTSQAFMSAYYDGTNWSFDSRYVNNVAFKCKMGFNIHKSKHNEIRNNIAFYATNYCLQFTDSAAKYGENYFRNNLWYYSTNSSIIKYCGNNLTGPQFAEQAGETGGIYGKMPQFTKMSSPYDFTLKESSPCIGAGDEGGVDVGAYPVYGPAPLGRQETIAAGSVGFDEVYAEAMRGDTYTATLRLPKALNEPLTVRILPVAGDLHQGADFNLSTEEVTFQAGETVKSIEVTFMGDETEFSKLLVLKLTADDGETSFCEKNYLCIVLVSEAAAEKLKNTNIWLEAEDGELGSLWDIGSDTKASGGKYITVKNGNNSSSNAPGETGWASYTFDIKTSNTYTLWLRTICPSANDDSFWMRMDDGSWSQWNGIPTSTAWQWNKSNMSVYLQDGKHTLYIGYREDGAKLDKMLLSCDETEPEGMGGDPTGIAETNQEAGIVTRIDYFDPSGQRIGLVGNNRFVIKKIHYSNGTVKTMKMLTR